MKNFLTRSVAVLLGVALLAEGVFIIVLSPQLLPVLWTRFKLGAAGAYPLTVAMGGIDIAVSLFLLLAVGFRPSRRPLETVIQYSELGEVRISIAAIENMVQRVTQRHEAVKESSRKVVNTAQGLVVYLKARVLPDLNLPDLASELQKSIKNYIEEVTGVTVAEVKVLVENIVPEIPVLQKKPPLK